MQSMMAQDPSHKVAQQLQGHVHLISNYRFPQLTSMDLEQAYKYLIDAPTIVKQAAAMAWQYVQAPQDGTLWLEWIPRGNNGEYRIASDGYVWADPEQTYRSDFGGYSIEWMQHTLGYRQGYESMATHARTRFHFIAKNPGVHAPQPDANLWLVHYHQAEQRRFMPVNNIPIAPQIRQTVSERRWLEAQGKLERKDFMLHDSGNWPHITIPTANPHMQQAMHQQQQQQHALMQQQLAQQRFPQQAFSQGGSQGGPPAKRPRTSGPSGLPGSSDGLHDTSIEEDENQLLDYFDHLTPRDISYARYTQHHKWMDEVFSSPYATSRIVPPDLGLGLMGELKGLTDGILNPPAVDDVQFVADKLPDREKGEKEQPFTVYGKPSQAKEAQPFTNLSASQIEEFDKRVNDHLEREKAEIEKMKKEHAEKMGEWRRMKGLMRAEKRLRYAGWGEGAVQDVGASVWRLEGGVEGGQGSGETVEDVVRDVEGLLGVRVRSQRDAMLVRKGGLERDDEDGGDVKGSQRPLQQQLAGNGGMNGAQRDVNKQPSPIRQPEPRLQQETRVSNVNALSTSTLQPEELQNQPMPSADAASPPQQQIISGFDDLADTQQDFNNDVSGMDVGDNSLMDDVDMGDIDFVQHDEDEFGEDPADAITSTVAQADSGPAPAMPLQSLAAEVPEQTSAAEPGQPMREAALPLATDQQDLEANTFDILNEPGDELVHDDPGVSTSLEDPNSEDNIGSLAGTTDAAVDLPVMAEEPAIPAMAEDASLGNEPDRSATAFMDEDDEDDEDVDFGGEPERSATDFMAEMEARSKTAGGAAAGGDIGAGEEGLDGGNLFDDGTFDDLPGMEGDDGLVDFGGGDDGTGFGMGEGEGA